MIEIIDVEMHGRPGLTAAFLIGEGSRRICIDCGPASSGDAVMAGFAEHGVEDLEWLLLTHVHLDHAGGAGRLAREFPNLRIGVHPAGARHIADPSKLWAAVAGLYGERAESMWGQPEPVEPERIVEFAGGETVEFGDAVLRAVATPGHARHHLTWFEETTRSLITGDAVGMHQTPGDLWRTTTPPAAFDRDQALASIAALAELPAERLYVAHFGAVVDRPDPVATAAGLGAGAQTIRDWCKAVESAWRKGLREDELNAEMARWIAEAEQAADPDARRRLDETTTVSLDVGGVTGWLERAT
jgi:glyoxylase-like metal-dependent hydrolase (beta-lactamase superfamily II)